MTTGERPTEYVSPEMKKNSHINDKTGASGIPTIFITSTGPSI